MRNESGQSDTRRFLNFSLGKERFAIELQSVKEVIGIPKITAIPSTPPHFLGIMNLRGLVISVIDLRLKFKMKKAENVSESAIIILDLGGLSLGMVVDAVNSVIAISPSEMSPSPTVETSFDARYIQGVVRSHEELIVVLDIAKALDVEDRRALEAQSAEISNAA